MREADYQRLVIKRLSDIFPGCFVLRNDSRYQQGIPDLTVLWKSKWAMLEVKTSAKANIQPNQRHYVKVLDDMSFAAFIYPDNEEEVLNALQSAFRT